MALRSAMGNADELGKMPRTAPRSARSLAYDFTVDGLVTDAAQCLEGFAAANGPVFTQCRPN
jgi:hypothetical protein